MRGSQKQEIGATDGQKTSHDNTTRPCARWTRVLDKNCLPSVSIQTHEASRLQL